MSNPIGYYIHHQGAGHRQRALAIANAAPGRFTLIGTGLAGLAGPFDRLDLPDDRMTGVDAFTGEDATSERPMGLQYAPLYHEGVRARVALMTSWIERAKPALMVVDVSVEIAMLSRLAATPTVYVRLSGARDDMAHLEAFRGAKALLAPFHEDLDEPHMIDWVRAKTHYFPGLTTSAPSGGWRQDTVLFVHGMGGPPGNGERLAALARSMPRYKWRAVGPCSEPAQRPANLDMLGWVDDPDAEIARADVVVGGAGDGLVTAMIAAARPFICLAQSRAFGEQGSKARRLGELGAAVVIEDWPDLASWPRLIAAAEAMSTDALRRLHDPDGPARAAQFLIATADGSMPHADE